MRGASPPAIELGPLTVALEGEPAWRSLLEPRFGRFRSARPPDLRLEYRLGGPAPDGLESPLQIRNEPVSATLEADRLAIDGESFRAEFELEARAGWIVGPMALYPLDLTLWQLLPVLLPEALVLHGALVGEPASAWMAVGPSGAGKSTLAGLWKEKARGEEMVVATLVDGGLEAWSLPWVGHRPGACRVEGLLLLRHGRDRHELRRLDASEAFRRLARECTWSFVTEGLPAAILGRLAEVVRRVPTWELSFLPRPDVVAFVEREALA